MHTAKLKPRQSNRVVHMLHNSDFSGDVIFRTTDDQPITLEWHLPGFIVEAIRDDAVEVVNAWKVGNPPSGTVPPPELERWGKCADCPRWIIVAGPTGVLTGDGLCATFRREDSKRAVAHVGQSAGTHRADEAVEYNGLERNLRSVWSLASSPFPDAHFATFPVEIPTTAIKAGTSERGCCPSCGAPWARVVSVEGETTQERAKSNGHSGHAAAYGGAKQNLDLKGSHWKLPPRERSTTGWRPTCACPPAEPIPCTVLDPFNGAGTSGLAAARLGRSYTGIDLNQEYCDMARRRIEEDAPLLNAVEPEEDPQVPLFDAAL